MQKKDEKFRFTQMPSDLIVSEGANVEFKCSSNSPHNTLYNWLKVFNLIKILQGILNSLVNSLNRD